MNRFNEDNTTIIAKPGQKLTHSMVLEIIETLEHFQLVYDYSVAVVALGSNDLRWNKHSLPQMQFHIQLLVEYVAQHPKLFLILPDVIPSPDCEEGAQTRIRALHKHTQQLARDIRNVLPAQPCKDLYKEDKSALNGAMYQQDEKRVIHLNHRGTKKYTERLGSVIRHVPYPRNGLY